MDANRYGERKLTEFLPSSGDVWLSNSQGGSRFEILSEQADPETPARNLTSGKMQWMIMINISTMLRIKSIVEQSILASRQLDFKTDIPELFIAIFLARVVT